MYGTEGTSKMWTINKKCVKENKNVVILFD
jgi:hypothetical protein